MAFNRDRHIEYVDKALEWCFMGLVFVLPMAHTMFVRSVFTFVPVALWLYKMVLRRGVIFERSQLTLPICVFAVVAGLSYYTAVDRAYTLHELREEMGMDFLLFFLVLNNVRNMRQVSMIVIALVAGTLANALYGVAHYAMMKGDLLDYGVKEGAFTAGYISYSVFLVTAMPFIAYKLMTCTRRFRPFYWGLLALNAFMAYVTFQRAALIALAVQLLLFLWLTGRRLVSLLLACVFAAGLYLAPQNLLYHGAADVDLSASPSGNYANTINSRVALWRFSINEISRSPFTGIGFGRYSFAEKFSRFKHTELWHALNTFINLTLQLGVQGLLAFLFLLYRILKTQWIGMKDRDEGVRVLFLAFFASTIGFFIRNMFDDHYVDDNAQMFWVLTGLSLALFINVRRLRYSDFFSRDPSA